MSACSFRAALEQIGANLSIQEPSDWYKVTVSQFQKAGGGKLLKDGHKLRDLLRTAYPESEWHDWQFKQTAKGYWSSVKNQRQFFDWAAPKLSIVNLEDWYKVSSKDIDKLGGMASAFDSLRFDCEL